MSEQRITDKSDLDKAVNLAREWIAWSETEGDAEWGRALVREAEWARALVAMAGVCDAVRLGLRTLPSRHHRERLGDPRLHRIFDELEAIDGAATSAGLETEVVGIDPQNIGALPAKAKRSRKNAASRGEKASGR